MPHQPTFADLDVFLELAKVIDDENSRVSSIRDLAKLPQDERVAGVSLSTIQRWIVRIEDRFGGKDSLIERPKEGKRGERLKLTEFGKQLKQQLIHLKEEIDFLSENRKPRAGRTSLKVVTFVTFQEYLLPYVVPKFEEDFKEPYLLSIQTVKNSKECESYYLEGAELILDYQSKRPEDIEGAIELGCEFEHVVVIPKAFIGKRIAKKKRYSLEDLTELPLVFTSRVGPATFWNDTPSPKLSVGSNRSVIEFLRTEEFAGITIGWDKITKPIQNSRFIMAPVEGARHGRAPFNLDPIRPVLITRPNISKAASVFADCIHKYVTANTTGEIGSYYPNDDFSST